MNLNKSWNEPELDEIEGPPHPSTIKVVEVVEKTPWMYCGDARAVPKSHEKSSRCQVAEEITRDPYGMVLSVKPIVRHQYYDEKQKRWNGDIACSAITPQNFLAEATQSANISGLRDRFGTAIQHYITVLIRDDQRRDDLPIVLFGDVLHPLIINAARCHQIQSLNEFAGLSKQDTKKLADYLLKNGQRRMSQNVEAFKVKAREHLDSLLGTGPVKDAA